MAELVRVGAAKIRATAQNRSGPKSAYYNGADSHMWLKIGLASSALFVIVAVVKHLFTRKSDAIDVGPVSEAWLAEQRKRREHSY